MTAINAAASASRTPQARLMAIIRINWLDDNGGQARREAVGLIPKLCEAV
jgi:hypothetical protein